LSEEAQAVIIERVTREARLSPELMEVLRQATISTLRSNPSIIRDALERTRQSLVLEALLKSNTLGVALLVSIALVTSVLSVLFAITGFTTGSLLMLWPSAAAVVGTAILLYARAQVLRRSLE
jgi:hypothetical protein